MKEYKIIVVLGKRLINGRITKEYASRIKFLVEELKSGRVKADLIGFSGGKPDDVELSQAEVGAEYFKKSAEENSLSLPEIFLEEQSKTTVENIKNVTSYIRRRFGCSIEKISLILTSSDYHLSCMETIDKRMPAQSLLKPAHDIIGEINLLRAPYPFLEDSDEIKKWESRLYISVNKLIVMMVNVEGVLEGCLDKIILENIEDFRNNLFDISKELFNISVNGAQVQKIQNEAGDILTFLVSSYFEFATMTQDAPVSSKAKQILKLHYKAFKEEVDRMNGITDPDEILT